MTLFTYWNWCLVVPTTGQKSQQSIYILNYLSFKSVSKVVNSYSSVNQRKDLSVTRSAIWSLNVTQVYFVFTHDSQLPGEKPSWLKITHSYVFCGSFLSLGDKLFEMSLGFLFSLFQECCPHSCVLHESILFYQMPCKYSILC